MENAKHTPGPWYTRARASWQTSLDVESKDKRLIAIVESGGYNQNSNARLIAAAPEMARALALVLSESKKLSSETVLSAAAHSVVASAIYMATREV